MPQIPKFIPTMEARDENICKQQQAVVPNQASEFEIEAVSRIKETQPKSPSALALAAIPEAKVGSSSTRNDARAKGGRHHLMRTP